MSTSYETKCDHCRTIKPTGPIEGAQGWVRAGYLNGPLELTGHWISFDLCPSCFTLFKKFVGEE